MRFNRTYSDACCCITRRSQAAVLVKNYSTKLLRIAVGFNSSLGRGDASGRMPRACVAWIELDRHELLDTRKVSLIGDDDSH
jgi:hypothetical protein